jgi:hypothetical protein
MTDGSDARKSCAYHARIYNIYDMHPSNKAAASFGKQEK